MGESWPTRRAERIEWLRGQLVGGGYDWASALAEATKTPGAWTDELDEVLREAWQDARPMAQVVDELLRSEAQIVRRMFFLDLSNSVVDVVERMGCLPGGSLATRYAIALGLGPTEVKVLIAVDAGGEVVHASVHAPGEITEDLQGRVLLDYVTATLAEDTGSVRPVDDVPQVDPSSLLRWTVLTRQVGGQGYVDGHLQ